MRVPRKRLSELIRFVAADEGARLAEVDLAVVTGPQMAALNRRYLDRSGPTDVLSFDLTESGERGLSAQLIVCGETAVAQAAARGCTRQRELMLYVIHGLLHLMGYDDSTSSSAAEMHARAEQVISAFGERLRRDRQRKRS